MKSDLHAFLEPGEAITDTLSIRDDALSVNFDILSVKSPVIGDGDRVLLDIYTNSSKNVLIGGNPLYVDVLKGLGKVSMIDLKDGTYSELILWPNKSVTIPSDNVVYWYENMSTENLQLCDTCPGFDLAHEPSVQDVVLALSKSLLLATD